MPPVRVEVEGVTLAATGMAVPGPTDGAPDGLTGRVENEVLLARRYPLDQRRTAAQFHFMVEDLRDRLGLCARHHVHAFGDAHRAGEPTSADLAALAAQRALEAAGMRPADLGALLLATSTPHRWTAAACASVAQHLAFEGPFMDIRMGCAGGIVALIQGAMWARATGRPVMVMGADTFSRAVPPGQLLAALALGDAGAAVVVAPGGGTLVGAWDGAAHLAHLMTTPGTLPPTAEQLAAHAYTLAGDPDAMALAAVPRYADVIAQVLRGAGTPARLLLHQTQRPLMAKVRAAAGLDGVPMPEWLGEHANTGTANVLLGLHLQGAQPGGQEGLTAMAAVGGGLGASAAGYHP